MKTPKIDYIQIAKDSKTGEIIGYIPPGKPGVVSREYLETTLKMEAPVETPCNVIEV